MNRIVKSNGFRGAVHVSPFLLGAHTKRIARAHRLERHLLHSREIWNKSHPKEIAKGIGKQELMGWLAVEIFLLMTEIAYLIH